MSLLLVLMLQALGEGPALENGYVRVSRDAAPCASANVPGCGDRVIVALGVVELRSGSSRRILKRGDIAVFAAGASYEPPKGAFFEVVIKPNHPAVESPGKIIPPEKNAVLFDGKEFFVFEERLGVGDTRARHSHNQRVVIQLNRTRLQQWPEGQSEIVRDIEPDRPTFNPPVIHTVKNVGDLPLRGIVIEFKASKAADPSVQYRSPAGVDYRAQLDTGAIARAESALAADPSNVERIIALGVAQSGARQFREAIQTFTRGLAIAPNNALLYRWRGHRYLSVRDFDRAMDDLTHGARLDSTIYGIWYHLGIVRFVRGDFAGAADAFARGQPRAPDAGEQAGATDWLWMSLMRAGRSAEAQAMLARRPDSLPTTNAYARRLNLYRGEISPDSVFTPADTADVQVATLSYGVGNWYFVRGDTSRARAWFERSVRSGGWPAFGFILSEIELRRLR